MAEPPPPPPAHGTPADAPPPPAAPQASPDAWKPGDVVCIAGLSRRQDLNGKRAEVLSWEAASSLYAVAVASSGERVLVKARNLTGAKRLLVEVVSGLSGSGKRALVQHASAAARGEGLRVGVLVNDAGIGEGQPLEAVEARVPGGCICCGLAGEFAAEVARIAQLGAFDHLLVEASDHAEPKQIAELFRPASSEPGGSDASEGAEGRRARRRREAAKTRLQAHAELDTMVSVLDGAAVAAYLQEAGAAASEAADAGSLAELIVHQVEMADMIVVHSAGALSTAQARDVKSFLNLLNPEAGCMFARPEEVPTYEVIGRGAYMWEQLGVQQPSRKWLAESAHGFSSAAAAFSSAGCAAACCALPGQAAREEDHENGGVDSYTFRPARPFHPARVMAVVTGQLCFPPSVLRITGTCWLASRPGRRGNWSTQRGRASEIAPGAPWWVTVPRQSWPDAVAQQLVQKGLLTTEGRWSDEQFGDCHSELSVVGGPGFKTEVLEVYLTELLLSDSEYELGPAAWASFDDPLPAWSLPPSADSLYCLALAGAGGLLEAFCIQGADVNAASGVNGGTALHAACVRGRAALAEQLLQRQADAAAAARRGTAPLHLASSPGVVEVLCRHGCDVQQRDDNGHTPLHHAASMARVEVAAALLSFGAEASALTSEGETPLHLSAASRHPRAPEVIRLLLAARADAHLRSGGAAAPDAVALAREAGDEAALHALLAADATGAPRPPSAS